MKDFSQRNRFQMFLFIWTSTLNLINWTSSFKSYFNIRTPLAYSLMLELLRSSQKKKNKKVIKRESFALVFISL